MPPSCSSLPAPYPPAPAAARIAPQEIQARGALQDPACVPLIGLMDQLGLSRRAATAKKPPFPAAALSPPCPSCSPAENTSAGLPLRPLVMYWLWCRLVPQGRVAPVRAAGRQPGAAGPHRPPAPGPPAAAAGGALLPLLLQCIAVWRAVVLRRKTGFHIVSLCVLRVRDIHRPPDVRRCHWTTGLLSVHRHRRPAGDTAGGAGPLAAGAGDVPEAAGR